MTRTTLSSQLLNLRDLGHRANFSQKRKSSLLFDPKLAGDLDRTTLLEIGLEGLCELEKYDERFKEFRSTLFNPTTKGVDRHLITKDQEDLIKMEVKSFLCLLSPVLLSSGSLKALEWLVRRFMIANFDYVEIIGSIIPYHDTVLFVQIVGILTIPNQSRFSFLRRVQKTRLPFPRSSIVKFIASDFSLLEFLFSLAEESRENGIHNPALNSMVGMIIVQYIEFVKDIDENYVRTILSNLSHWQKKPDSPMDLDLIHVSFMGIAALSRKVCLNEDTLRNLIGLAILSLSEQTFERVIEYLSVITSSIENPFTLPADCLESLLKDGMCDSLLSKYVELNDPHLLIFIIKATLLHLSKCPSSYTKFKKNLSRLISSIDCDHLLSSGVTSITASLTTEKNSDVLLDLISHLNTHVDNVMTTVDNINTTQSNSSTVPNVSSKELSPNNYLLLLKSGNEHVIKSLLSSKQLLLNSVPPSELLHLLSNVMYSTSNSELVSQCYNIIIDIPEELIEINQLADVVAGNIWPRKSKSSLSQTLSSINAISRSKKLQNIFGTLENTKSIFTSSKGKAPANFIALCVTEIASNILDDGLLVLWINWLNSSYPYTQLLALAVVSLYVKNSRLSLPNTEAIATFLSTFNPTRKVTCDISLFKKDLPDLLAEVSKENYSELDDLLTILKVILAKMLLNSLPSIEPQNNGVCFYLSNFTANPERPSLLYSLKIALSVIAPLLFSPENDTLNLDIFFSNQSIELFAAVYIETFGTEYYDTLKLCVSQIRRAIKANHDYDYQLIVPLLMSALTLEDRTLRVMTIDVLKDIAEIYPNLQKKGKMPNTSTIFAYDTFYGDYTKEVLYTTYTASHHLVKQLIKCEGLLISSHKALANVLRDSFHASEKLWKGEIVSFLCSASLSIPSYAIKSVLLGSLREINSPKKVKLLLSYLPEAIKISSRQILDKSLEVQAQQYVSTIQSTFDTILSALQTPSAASVLNSSNDIYIKIFIDVLSSTPLSAVHGQPPINIQRTTLRFTVPQLFDNLKASNKDAVFNTLIGIASCSMECTPEAVFDTKELLKNLDIDVHLISSFVDTLLMHLTSSNNPDKRTKLSSSTDNAPVEKSTEVSDTFKRAVTFFELVLLKKNVIRGKLELSGSLSELLKIVVNSRYDISVNLEYLKQLLLSTMFHVVKRENHSDLVPETASGIRVDCIVTCIRETENLQTQNSALLLLSAIADTHPEEALLNIMPVFIFIGTNIIRKDDNYNFYVIHRTLETVLPALVANKSVNSSASHASMSKVSICINVFVGALPHIPKHRRFRLFTTLVQTLGQDRYLNLVAIHLIRLSLMTKLQSQEEVLDFAKSLFLLFPLHSCLTAALELVKTVSKIPDEVSGYSELSSMVSLETAHVLFRGSTKRLSKIRLSLSNFVMSILSSTEFADKFLDINAAIDAYTELQADFIQNIIDSIYIFSSKISNNVLVRSLTDSLTKITSLQTHQSFVGSVSLLLKDETLDRELNANSTTHTTNNKDMNIVQNRFLSLVFLLSSKLPHHLESGSINATDILSIRDLLLRIVELSITPKYFSSELCLPAVFDLFSTLACTKSAVIPNLLSDFAPKIIYNTNLTSSDSIFESGIKCVSNIYLKLSDDCISSLAHAMELIKNRVQRECIPSFISTILNFYATLLNVAPEFLTPYLGTILNTCFGLNLYAQHEATKDSELKKLEFQVKQLLNTIIKSIRLSSVLEHVCAFFQKVVSMDSNTFARYIDYVKDIISSATLSNTFLEHYYDVFKLLLVCSDYRRVYFSKLLPSEILMVESKIISAFVALFEALDTEKISFLFSNMFKWGTSTTDGTGSEDQLSSLEHRIAFLYRAASSLVTALRDRFNPCAVRLIERARIILRDTSQSSKLRNPTKDSEHSTKLKSRNYQSQNIETPEYSPLPVLSEHDENNQQLEDLPTIVIDFICIFFKSSSEPSVPQDTLTPIMEYLFSMIPSGGPSVTKCLCSFHPILAKCNLVETYLNHILTHTKSPDPRVKLASIFLLNHVFTTLKDSLAGHVPEVIPYISELLEDDDPLIETACKDLLKTIEEYSGCPLEHYF